MDPQERLDRLQRLFTFGLLLAIAPERLGFHLEQSTPDGTEVWRQGFSPARLHRVTAGNAVGATIQYKARMLFGVRPPSGGPGARRGLFTIFARTFASGEKENSVEVLFDDEGVPLHVSNSWIETRESEDIDDPELTFLELHPSMHASDEAEVVV